MTDISLCKFQLLNVSFGYTITETCGKVIGRLGKFKMDLIKELFIPLIDDLAFLGQAASDINQFKRDIIKPRLPGRMGQLAKNVPNGSELLFGDDLNKRITQINNTNNALLTKPSHTVASCKPATNQTGRCSSGKKYNISTSPKQQLISKKLASLQEKLCYWEKGEQTEQQPLLLELKKVIMSNFKAGNLRNHYSDWEKNYQSQNNSRHY